MIRTVRKTTSLKIITGGGIRTPEKAIEIATSGANIIVTGNIIESDLTKALKIIESIKKIKISE